jgi:uncharacterized protein involved in outer membrane biogenesis
VRKGLIAAVGVLVLLAAGVYLLAQRALAGDLVRSQIEQQLSSRLGQPVHIGSASVSILPRISIDLHDLTVGQSSRSQLGRVRLVVGIRGLLSRRIENASAILDDGRIVWPLPFGAAGRGSSEPNASGVTIVSVREIQFRNVTIITSLPPVTVDLDAALTGDRLDVTRLTARSDANRIDASGAITSVSRLEGRFRATGSLTVAGFTPRNLAATIAVTPTGISMPALTFGMFDGKFDGSLAVDLREAIPQIQLSGSVARLDVAALVKNTGAAGGVTGRLVGTISVTGSGSDGTALMRTAHGNIRINVVDGTLPYINIVRPVVLAFGKPSGAAPSGSGSSFSTLSGAFTLRDSRLASQNLTLEARDFTAHGAGSLNIGSGAVDSRLDLVLSQELTSQAGSDLRRYAEQNGRVIVPATVGGTITHPTVFVDTAAAATRAAENELKRKASSLLKGIIKR